LYSPFDHGEEGKAKKEAFEALLIEYNLVFFFKFLQAFDTKKLVETLMKLIYL
jgi:hypothetical protein